MPVYFQFEKDGKTMSLSQIDDEMCVASGEPIHETESCWLYRICTEIGCSSKVHNDAGQVDKQKLEELLDKATDLDPKWRQLIIRFLVEEYTFSAWWQAKI